LINPVAARRSVKSVGAGTYAATELSKADAKAKFLKYILPNKKNSTQQSEGLLGNVLKAFKILKKVEALLQSPAI
jgi:hypothetical protein